MTIQSKALYYATNSQKYQISELEKEPITSELAEPVPIKASEV